MEVGALALGRCGHAPRGKADGAEGPELVSSVAFYDSPHWRRLREAILRRDGYRCRECARFGRIRQATTVHHIQHLEARPDLAYEPDNLVSLCAACHARAHPEKSRELAKRLRGR